MFDGKVRIAKRAGAYGNLVVIRHDNGLETYYAHLSKINVEVNQDVKAGEILGLGGSTGRSTGPHLHLEIRYLGAAINPEKVIDFKTYSLISDTLMLTQDCFKKVKTPSSQRNSLAKNSSDSKSSKGGKYEFYRFNHCMDSQYCSYRNLTDSHPCSYRIQICLQSGILYSIIFFNSNPFKLWC